VCFVVLSPSMLCAQQKDTQKREFGLTFPNIGIIWHITEDVAFLPGISFNHSWGSSDAISDNWSNSLNVDASIRFYIQEWKGVRFYLAPKYSFGWGDSEARPDSGTGPATIDSTTHSHAVSGAWGIQYAISDRISIWGDIGVRYSHAEISTSGFANTSYESRNKSIGAVGTWGLILYLK
jgi:hypothetical protein